MGLPLWIVDHVSFNNFMYDGDPKYKLINRRDITRSHLPILHKRCVSKLQEICSQLNYVSLTLDVWSDRRMRSYFGITAHAIIDDKHRSFLLSFERLEGHHTADKLSAEFDRVIQLYDLNNKVVRLITDNASNNLAAFDNLILPGFEEYFDEISDDRCESNSDDESSDDDSFDQAKELRAQEVSDSIYHTTLNPTSEDEFLRLPCFCHCLQLVARMGRILEVLVLVLERLVLVLVLVLSSVLCLLMCEGTYLSSLVVIVSAIILFLSFPLYTYIYMFVRV